MTIPMLANGLELDSPKYAKTWEAIRNGNYVMEPKLDGMRMLLHFDSRGRLFEATTRSGRSVLDMLPQAWRDQLGDIAVPMDMVLDCEFGYQVDGWTEGNACIDFNKTMRVMGSGAEVAQAKALTIDSVPTAFVFDVLQIAGEDYTVKEWHIRRNIVDSLYCTHSAWPGMTRTRLYSGWDEAIYENYVRLGGEGVMLKNVDSLYTEGARPAKHWYKVKKFQTADVVITGFQEGQGKYTGMIGAVKFGVYSNGSLTEIGQCSGMTDEVRESMTRREFKLVGHVMEIKYFGLTAGTYRHPQFMRLRTDKLPEQCVIE